VDVRCEKKRLTRYCATLVDSGVSPCALKQ